MFEMFRLLNSTQNLKPLVKAKLDTQKELIRGIMSNKNMGYYKWSHRPLCKNLSMTHMSHYFIPLDVVFDVSY